MNAYFQETDSKIVFPLPQEKININIPSIQEDVTFGSMQPTNYLPLPSESNLISDAWSVIRTLGTNSISKQAKKLLSEIHEIISTFKFFKFEVCDLPTLNAFQVEDGSLLIEWIFMNFRIGFSIEQEITESSWYLVTNHEFGEINASGYLHPDNNNNLLLWLINFILSRA